MIEFTTDLVRFWVAVAVGLAVKFVLTEEKQTRRKTLAGIVCGGACAFYGTDHLVAAFSIAQESRELVVIGLVITGEHIMRSMVARAPDIASGLVSYLSKGNNK